MSESSVVSEVAGRTGEPRFPEPQEAGLGALADILEVHWRDEDRFREILQIKFWKVKQIII